MEAKCAKGCSTKRCGCVKNGIQCGPGCKGKNCQNLPSDNDSCTQNSEVMQVEEEELLYDAQCRQGYGEELTDNEDSDVPDTVSSDEEGTSHEQCEQVHELMDWDAEELSEMPDSESL